MNKCSILMRIRILILDYLVEYVMRKKNSSIVRVRKAPQDSDSILRCSQRRWGEVYQGVGVKM